MEAVPALHLEPFTAELRKARHAPDIARDAEVCLEQVGPGDHLAEDRARAEQLHPGPLSVAFAQQVDPAEDALLRPLGQRRLRVILVHHGQVVEDVLLLLAHAPEAVPNDHRQLVSVRGVVGAAVGDDRGEQVRVPILVLEALAVERGTARGGADQKPSGPAVARCPGKVADPLEAEHRIEDVEGNHRHAVVRIRGRSRDPRREGTRFVDALLQDLAVLVLPVEHEVLGVLRLIQLTDLGEDAELAEHALHPEGA